jgi:hypothetical protein
MNARTVQIVRSVSVLAGTAALIAGATFAANTNVAQLTGNTFSAGAGLSISNTGNGTDWSQQADGFTFTGLHSGEDSAVKNVWLKADTGLTLTGMTVKAVNDAVPTGTDKDNVMVTIRNHGAATGGTTVSLTSLDSGLTLTDVTPAVSAATGTEYDVSLNVTLTQNAVSGSSTGFDLHFQGQHN